MPRAYRTYRSRRSTRRGRKFVRPSRTVVGGNTFLADSALVTLNGAASSNVAMTGVTAGSLTGGFANGSVFYKAANVLSALDWVIPGRPTLSATFKNYRVLSCTFTVRMYQDGRVNVPTATPSFPPIQAVLAPLGNTDAVPSSLVQAESLNHSRWIELLRYAPYPPKMTLRTTAQNFWQGQMGDSVAETTAFATDNPPIVWYNYLSLGKVDRALGADANSAPVLLDFEISWKVLCSSRVQIA